MSSLGSSLKGMFSFFTMLPIAIDRKNIDDMNRNFWLAPVVGVLFGLMSVAVFSFVTAHVTAAAGAAIALFSMEAFNRFLHLDGTMDVGDGLTVAGTREDHIRALKDTAVGAGAVATGVLVVLMAWSEMSSLSVVQFICFGAAVEVLCRYAQVAAAAMGNAGRGMAGDSVRFTGMGSLVKSTALTAALLAGIVLLTSEALSWRFGFAYPFEYAVVLALAAVVAPLWGFIMATVANRNFGIVNGDVLGATNESARVAVFFVILLGLAVLRWRPW